MIRFTQKRAYRINDLLAIMRDLRTPQTGCAWDLEQTYETIAPYTIEEAYEVADAIERGDPGDLRDELGDLLLQVVFHAQIAADLGHFTFDDVTHAISQKMVRRHPHVFGSEDQRSAGEQTLAWEEVKAQERRDQAGQDLSALAGIARALPALMRAEKLQKRAARSGFDWTDPKDIFAKLEEEIGEVKDAIAEQDRDHIEEEIGDVLFVVANLARRLDVDPEVALRKSNAKFERRFRAMEQAATGGPEGFKTLTLDEQDILWRAVKSME